MYGQTTFLELPEQEKGGLPCLRGASPASRTALQACVERLLTNVTSGRSTGALFATLNQDGSWAKTWQGYCQVTLDGSLETFSGTWPTWGMMLAGACTEPPTSERFIPEKGFSLLPTPLASQFSMWSSAKQLLAGKKRRKSGAKIGSHLNYVLAKWHLQNGGSPEGHPDPCFSEKLMGFPIGWTDLGV